MKYKNMVENKYLKFTFRFSIVAWLFISFNGFAQNKVEFDGQISAIGSFAPDNEIDVFLGVRYIPELNYQVPLDSAQTKSFDFEASVNIAGSIFSNSFKTNTTDGDIQPYRIWARYTNKQFEVRVGLQKIDFGAAAIIRPLQWFNQIDPRDPLQLTNGVYGILGRYYFLNNANIWLWTLYGNEKTRGFDFVETNKKIPEFGGRIQYPTSKGEIALSYHHRTASSMALTLMPQYQKIPENRIGIDGKWDIGVGLWFEGVLVHKTKNLGSLTNQALFNIGTDYTFGIGNGLNIILEHLLVSFDEKPLQLENTVNITATTISYPLGFFDNVSSVFTYNWGVQDVTFALNYQHQFKKIIGYLIASYTPSNQFGIQQNDLVNQFAGPAVRAMLVYNH
ncbi:MAG: hypothetical protein R3E32_06110 [Chitinophagales bacterium]